MTRTVENTISKRLDRKDEEGAMRCNFINTSGKAALLRRERGGGAESGEKQKHREFAHVCRDGRSFDIG